MVFTKIADFRQQTTFGEQNATGRTMCVRVLILSLRRRISFLVIIFSSSRVIVFLIPQYVSHPTPSHPTPHVVLLAAWRCLSWSSSCDANLEIIHIIRCKSFVCCQVVLCIFSQQQIGLGHVYIEYTQKVVRVLLMSAPKKYCAGKMRIHYFSGQVFFV